MIKILVVDDDKSMLNFLNSALKNSGYDITCFDNGLDALKEIQSNPNFDLLLTDIIMPGMDGVELSREAEKICPDLQTMFMTGFSAMALGDKNPEQNDRKVMAKPFHMKHLLAQIEETLPKKPGKAKKA